MAPQAPRPPARPVRPALAWLGWWVALAVLWLALTDTRKLPELVAGAVAAAVGASAAVGVSALGLVALRVRLRWLAGLWRPLVRMGPDTVLLLVALGRRLAGQDVRGAFAERPFRRGEDAESRGVMVKVAGSMAPATYVVRVDEHTGRLVAHRLPADAERARAAADPLGLA